MTKGVSRKPNPKSKRFDASWKNMIVHNSIYTELPILQFKPRSMTRQDVHDINFKKRNT